MIWFNSNYIIIIINIECFILSYLSRLFVYSVWMLKSCCLCIVLEKCISPMINVVILINRGMLSNAVYPPTTEHFYAQWHEREEFPSKAPLGLLQEENGQSIDVKEEELSSIMSGEPINHFKTSRAVRLKFKGNVGNASEILLQLTPCTQHFFLSQYLCLKYLLNFRICR